jgi:hypothetical protein
MNNAEELIRAVLEDEIKIEDELEWCIGAERVLIDVLTGIVLRKKELELEAEE